MRIALTGLALISLAGCSSGHSQDYLTMRAIAPPTLDNFVHCYNYGCDSSMNVALPHYTIKKIGKIFTQPAKSSEEEKQKIIQSIQIVETDIGQITGTQNDKGGTFKLYQDATPSAKKFQQDCIDESTNTTIYLTLLKNMGHLTFFEPAFPANRQPFLSGNRWWHQTAVIREKSTSNLFAVDTWFEDNGKAGYIVPLKEWKAGWSPA